MSSIGATSAAAPIVGFSLPVRGAFLVAQKAHGIWSWCRKGQIYTNLDNALSLIGGHGLNLIAGNIGVIRITAVFLQTAARIEAIVLQIKELSESAQRLKSAFRNEFLPPVKYKWITESKISATLISQARYKLVKLGSRIKTIFLSILHLIKNAAILLMRIMDAMDTLNFKKETVDEAVNQFFVNGSTLIDGISSCVPELKRIISGNKPIIHKVLDALKSKTKTKDLIEKINMVLDEVVEMNENLNPPKDSILKDVRNTVIAGLGSIFGFYKYLPKEYRPEDSRLDKYFEPAPRHVIVAVKC